MGEQEQRKPHDWFSRFGLICCTQCGFVKNETSHLRPCKGRIKVELRGPHNKDTGNG